MLRKNFFYAGNCYLPFLRYEAWNHEEGLFCHKPYIGEEGSKERNHADRVRQEIIDPIAGHEFGYDVTGAEEYMVSGQIALQIVKLIADADLVIADLSFHNPNVFYELALRHVTRKPFMS